MIQNRIFTIFFIILLSYLSQAKKLIYVQQLFRHGARYPIYKLGDAKLPKQIQQQKLYGELTDQGKHMQYVLGKMMYDKYWKALFGGTYYQNNYNPNMIYVKSTNVNRTIISAQSQLQGIYSNLKPLELPIGHINISLPPFVGAQQYAQKVQQNQTSFHVFGPKQPHFYPIPIHTVKQSMISKTDSYKYSSNPYDQGDYLAKYEPSNCPNQQFWGKENMINPMALKIKQSSQVKQLLSKLSQFTNTDVRYQDTIKFYDQYHCLKSLGIQYGELFKDPAFMKTLDFAALSQQFLTYFGTERQIKTSNTRFVQKTVNFMKQAIVNQGPKLVLFSAHDTNIMSFSSALQLMTVQCIMARFYDGVQNNDTCINIYPDFARQFIAFHKSTSILIHILYNGIAKKIPICGNKDSCPFSQFQTWANNFYIDDPNKQCGIKHQYLKFYIVIAILSLFVIIFVIIQMRSKLKKKLQARLIELQEKKGYIQNFQEKQSGNKEQR